LPAPLEYRKIRKKGTQLTEKGYDASYLGTTNMDCNNGGLWQVLMTPMKAQTTAENKYLNHPKPG